MYENWQGFDQKTSTDGRLYFIVIGFVPLWSRISSRFKAAFANRSEFG
jgi:hypothetical protein